MRPHGLRPGLRTVQHDAVQQAAHGPDVHIEAEPGGRPEDMHGDREGPDGKRLHRGDKGRTDDGGRNDN